MKRFVQSTRNPLPLLALLALPFLTVPAQGQTGAVSEKQEEALRRVEERLAQIQEHLEQMHLTEEANRARALAELEEAQLVRIQEFQAQAQEMGHEQAARAEMMAQEARRQLEQTLAHSQEREQERARRVEQERERVRELAIRVRERSAEDRSRLAHRVRDLQQVVVQVRARARLGVALGGTQGEEYDRQGAQILDVTEDSPADGAGLQEGDIITHLDGTSLTDPIPDEGEMEFGEGTSLPVQRLMALARDLEDGQEVEVRYLRDGAAETVTLEAAELDDNWVTVGPGARRGGVYRFGPEDGLRWRYSIPDEDFHVEVLPHLEDLDIKLSEFDWEEFQGDSIKGWTFREGEGPNFRVFRGGDAPNVAFFRDEESPDLALFRGEKNFAFSIFDRRTHGVEFQELNPELGAYFSTDRGVLVLEVDEDSTLGLRPGDVVLSVGDREVEDIRDVLRILGSYEDEEAVNFTVMRQGRETRVEGSIG